MSARVTEVFFPHLLLCFSLSTGEETTAHSVYVKCNSVSLGVVGSKFCFFVRLQRIVQTFLKTINHSTSCVSRFFSLLFDILMDQFDKNCNYIHSIKMSLKAQCIFPPCCHADNFTQCSSEFNPFFIPFSL